MTFTVLCQLFLPVFCLCRVPVCSGKALRWSQNSSVLLVFALPRALFMGPRWINASSVCTGWGLRYVPCCAEAARGGGGQQLVICPY